MQYKVLGNKCHEENIKIENTLNQREDTPKESERNKWPTMNYTYRR